MRTVSFPRVPANDPSKKGQLACRKKTFGDYSRYAVAPVHTRFDALSWFVWDAELPDETGKPSVIRQADNLEETLKGLSLV
jgi:hypothetical protein